MDIFRNLCVRLRQPPGAETKFSILEFHCVPIRVKIP